MHILIDLQSSHTLSYGRADASKHTTTALSRSWRRSMMNCINKAASEPKKKKEKTNPLNQQKIYKHRDI